MKRHRTLMSYRKKKLNEKDKLGSGYTNTNDGSNRKQVVELWWEF